MHAEALAGNHVQNASLPATLYHYAAGYLRMQHVFNDEKHLLLSSEKCLRRRKGSNTKTKSFHAHQHEDRLLVLAEKF